MKFKKSNHTHTYVIRVKETINPITLDWFVELKIIHQENGETVLVGQFADQPALRGLLDQLWNLNLTVLSVERMDEQRAQGFLMKLEERRQE
jgi:hypothetical protein